MWRRLWRSLLVSGCGEGRPVAAGCLFLCRFLEGVGTGERGCTHFYSTRYLA